MTRAQLRRLIGGVFGLAYVLVNAGVLSSPAAPVLRALAIAVFAGLVIASRQATAGPDGSVPRAMPFNRGYWLLAAAEAAAIVAGWAVITLALHAAYAVVGWISVVVGMHSAGLAQVWRQPFYIWLGVAITICGLAGLAVAAAGFPAAVIAALPASSPACCYWPPGSGGSVAIPAAPARSPIWSGHASSGKTRPTPAAWTPAAAGNAQTENPMAQHLRLSARARTTLPAGHPTDVIELIMADHRRIRRLSETLDNAARYRGDSGQNWMPARVWPRLAALLKPTPGPRKKSATRCPAAAR